MTLPTKTEDLDAIRALLEEMLQNGKSAEIVELVIGILQKLKEQNDELNLRLAKLLRERLARKSEKIPVEQLRLVLEELTQSQAAPEISQEIPDVTLVAPPSGRVKIQPRKGRRPLPVDLLREEIIVEPAAEEMTCAQCGTGKASIGHERSEVLEFVPAHFKVVVYARAKYACRRCEGAVTIAPTAPKPIESGRPGFGLLSDVLVKKYAEHCPLHRMHDIYLRHGVDLAVSSLANWVGAGADLLEPIARAIRRRTLISHVVQADDTGLRVLDSNKADGVKRGHMWAYLGDESWLSFDYTSDWSSEGPCAFLADRRGWLQADAYAGYDRLFRGPAAKVIEVGCWAHARRYFFHALDSDQRAAVALHYIGQLFKVEQDAKALGLDVVARLARRAEHSRPILETLGMWIKDTYPAAPPKSPLGQALTYAINQWRALTRCLEDGRLELTNNACERALRQIAVGRKNWLFAGSDEGARRAAVIFTVFGTCRLHGVDPWAYTRDVLEKLVSGWRQNHIDELLPPLWARLRRLTPSRDVGQAAIANA
jgi:transposase